MQTFNEILEETLQLEGGESNHPQDRGGRTKWGITEQTAEQSGYSIKTLTLANAKAIYKKQYWDKPHFDSIHKLSSRIAKELFDSGVNTGTHTASKWLQRSLNRLNKNQSFFSDLIVDGALGRKTFSALRFVLKNIPHGEQKLLLCLNGFQFNHYNQICERDAAQEVFFQGWLNRVSLPAYVDPYAELNKILSYLESESNHYLKFSPTQVDKLKKHLV